MATKTQNHVPPRGSPEPARLQKARVDRYLLLNELGRGSFGEVWRAYDPELDRKVAIKLLRSPLGGDGFAEQTRFLREAQAIAQLAHP